MRISVVYYETKIDKQSNCGFEIILRHELFLPTEIDQYDVVYQSTNIY